MRKIMKSGSFELGTDGVGIDVTSHDDAITFYAPLTAEQRRDLADALVPGRDFSGVDWKAMYEQAERAWGEEKRQHSETIRVTGEQYIALMGECDKWKARAEAAEARTAPAVSYEHLHQEVVAAYEYGRSPTERVEFIVKYMCALFGVESEPADPVEDKAREYLTVMFDYEEPDSASPAEWKAATQMARHVLGQEGCHVDQ